MSGPGKQHNPQGLILMVTACLCLLTMPASALDPDIRFYKANKKLQQDRIMDFGKGDEPGCHDFLKKTRVHRIGVVGYQHCVLYSERDCAAGSEIPSKWKEGGESKIELTQGARWFPEREDIRGTHVGSWNCVAAEPADEIAAGD